MSDWRKCGLIAGFVATMTLGLVETAPAQETVALPEGKVALHYFRPNGDYDGWGVHLWVSPNQQLPGVSWGAPMMPTGKDGFGVYWHVDADHFHDGKVNYIIHKGDTKDQCGKDMNWLIKDGKEVWVNAGDCNLYMSKDAALKARK